MAKQNDRLRQFDAQLKAVAAPMLEEYGFERVGRARLWMCPSETAKDVGRLVWSQVGESASMDAGRFTVEFGIYYPKYDRFSNGRGQTVPFIGACHLDVRTWLGILMQPPEDRWWRYEKVAEVAPLVVELGLPWLAATDTTANEAIYNTGKTPEPDRLRREAFERHRANS